MDNHDTCLSCVDCGRKACQKGNEALYPDYCLTKNAPAEQIEHIIDLYAEEENHHIMAETAKIQAESYGKLTRVEETILYARHMGAKKIGIATCTALLKESITLTKILRAHGFEVFSACCKVGAISKKDIGISEDSITRGPNICNPIMQAEILNEAGTDLNIVVGLCVGHDVIFHKYIQGPTTTMVVKDRVLGHNPVAALYTTHSFYHKLLSDK